MCGSTSYRFRRSIHGIHSTRSRDIKQQTGFTKIMCGLHYMLGKWTGAVLIPTYARLVGKRPLRYLNNLLTYSQSWGRLRTASLPPRRSQSSLIIIIINLIYIAQFDTNGILTALYIVITYIQMQYVHLCTYAEQSYKYTYTCLHIHTYTVTCTNIHLPTY